MLQIIHVSTIMTSLHYETSFSYVLTSFDYPCMLSSSSVPATADVDYSSDAVDAVFGPGDTTVYVDIPITVDSILEKLEYFNVEAALGLGAPSDAQIVSPDMAAVFIMDGRLWLVRLEYDQSLSMIR